MSELTGFSQKPAWLSIILILITATLGFVVIGPLIGFAIAMPFYDGTMFDLITNLSDPTAHPEIRQPILIMQGCATLIGLIIIPALYVWSIEKTNALAWITENSTSIVIVVITSAIVISFMAINSVFIEWNANFTFPDFLKEFGDWARERETQAEELTKFFTTFDSTSDFLFGILVIALLPAIGEELVFRGMLQPEIFRASGNHHIAIWVSAIIFSAFHMQFFGFVPRMLLGALFGYLYVWSGNLLLPMVAHFVNNGFSVLMMYLYQKGTITTDMDSPEAAPLPLVASLTLVFVVLLFYFKKYHSNHNQAQV
jgi:membrane protease YdiL (CAAX protease family)